LATPSDFSAASPNGGTYGKRSVVRMKDSGSPMPPSGLLDASLVSAFEAWVNGGYDVTCPTSSSTSAGGTTSGSTTSGGTTSGGTLSGGGSGPLGP
jgi:hypothetical protein